VTQDKGLTDAAEWDWGFILGRKPIRLSGLREAGRDSGNKSGMGGLGVPGTIPGKLEPNHGQARLADGKLVFVHVNKRARRI